MPGGIAPIDNTRWTVDNRAQLAWLRLGAGRLGLGPGGRRIVVPGYQPPGLPLPAIPTGLSWASPIVVAGPITCPKIASGESWPTPQINGLTIFVGTASPFTIGIPSAETWYPPRVAHVLVITPAAPAIATGEHWFSPTIGGGPKFISILPIASLERWPAPTLTGGLDGIFLYMSGVDRTNYLRVDSGTVNIDSQTIGRWHARFDLHVSDLSFAPVLGQAVIIQDFGRRVFAGCVSEVVTDRFMSTDKEIIYHVTAVDKSGICDHRVITGKTYAVTDQFGSPADVAGIILDIVANYLNGEGITPGGVPTDGSLGTLPSDLNFNFPTVTSAFDQIASLTGTVWWVDSQGVLFFASLAHLPAAPFNLSETSRNWRNLKTTQTTTTYYNKLYAVSNLNIVPGAGSGGGGGAGALAYTESFILSPGQPGVETQTIAGIPVGFRTSVAIGSIISITVNGNAQTFYDFVNNFHNQQRSGPNDFLWIFVATNNQVFWTYGPPLGATIVIKYVPYASTNTSLAQYGQALTPLNPEGDPLGTCGSGLYEGVIQVQNISSQADLNAIAAAELARIGGVPTLAEYETEFPGLQPGQIQNVNVPKSGLANLNMLITEVSGVYRVAALHSGSFVWSVKARNNLDPGNWVKWYERLIGRTANPLPVLQYEEGTFVLGAGSSVSSGVSLTNPYIVGRTGLMVEIVMAAAVPPTDETLVIQLLDNGSIIATLAMPASTLANQLITVPVPKSNQLYVYKGDVLNVNAFYQVTGPNPAPASGVTVKARWAM